MGIIINPIVGEDTLQTFYPKVNSNLEAIAEELNRILDLVEAPLETDSDEPLSVTVANIQAQLNALNSALSNLNAEQTDIELSISNVMSAVDVLTANLSAQVTQTEQNKNSITALQAAINTLTASVTSLTQQNTLSAWQTIPLQSGWVAAAGTTAQFRIDRRRVQLKGSISGGTYANGTVIATLPAGFRPQEKSRFHGTVLSTIYYRPCIIVIEPSGSVIVDRIGTGGCTWLSLDLIEFYVE